MTYGLSLNTIQVLSIWCLCEMENRIISVERILQYTSIPSEPPLVIESNRPEPHWPSHGEVDISNLKVLQIFILIFSKPICFSCSIMGSFKTICVVHIYEFNDTNCGLGPICPTLASCVTRPYLHFPWRNEDWNCWENGKW